MWFRFFSDFSWEEIGDIRFKTVGTAIWSTGCKNNVNRKTGLKALSMAIDIQKSWRKNKKRKREIFLEKLKIIPENALFFPKNWVYTHLKEEEEAKKEKKKIIIKSQESCQIYK